MSLIILQFAILWASRGIWAVIAFIMLLMLTALGFGGWLETPAHIQFAGWMLVLIHAAAMLVMMVAQNDKKYAYFAALKQAQPFQYAQMLVFTCSQVPVILIWTIGFGLISGAWRCAGGTGAVMLLFCYVCAQAIFGNLQKHLFLLSLSRRIALLIVVAGPWLVTAWILGMTSANYMMMPQKSLFECFLPVLGLIGLGFFQWLLGRRL